MTAYTLIPDTSIETGKPVRAVDGRALRDNPTAIAEGASGAPKFTGVQGPVVGTGGLYDGSVTATKLDPTTVGTLWVGGKTAGLSVYDIGSYIFASAEASATSYNPGATLAGSLLNPGGAYIDTNSIVKLNSTGTGMVGSWRCMGFSPSAAGSNAGTTLWLRIA